MGDELSTETAGAAAGPDRDFPQMVAARGLVEPAPRRVRGLVGGEVVFDTTRALYVWEWPNYPQYLIPVADVAVQHLHEVRPVVRHGRSIGARCDLMIGGDVRSKAATVYGPGADIDLRGTVRFSWDSLDAWFEEDEQVFVHPRNPYVRVDALRSHRHVRVELDGVVLADTHAPCLLFETGLPTRHYIDATDVRFEHLERSETVSECPYKGVTSRYWSVRTSTRLHPDLVWRYDFPLPAVASVRGMVAF